MRIAKKLKRDTEIVIISVIVLTLATMRIAYSAVFAVRSQTSVQEISSGTLNVVIQSTQMSADDLFPTATTDLPSEVDSVVEGSYASLILNNAGTIEADYSVTVSYDEIPAGSTQEDLISFNYLNIGVYDVDTGNWKLFGSNYYTPFSALTPSEENTYPIIRSTLAASASKQYRIYIWLKEDTPTSEIGKLAYLKLNIKSTTVNGRIEG